MGGFALYLMVAYWGADQKPPVCFSKETPIVSVNLDSALSSCYCCAFARAAVAG